MVSQCYTICPSERRYSHTYLIPLTRHCRVTLFRHKLNAHITLIPKPQKDPSLCSSYRPISLLNLDVKIYANILANRIKPLLRDLIHPDQTGFIPGREGKDNTYKVINTIALAKKTGTPFVLLGTDAEKAFDSVLVLY